MDGANELNMKKIILFNGLLVVVCVSIFGLISSQHFVSLKLSPFYQTVVNSTASGSNLISTINNLTIRSTKQVGNYYVIGISNKDGSSPAVVVVEKSGSQYKTVLGPGTGFSKSLASGLPSSLVTELIKEGLIYGKN